MNFNGIPQHPTALLSKPLQVCFKLVVCKRASMQSQPNACDSMHRRDPSRFVVLYPRRKPYSVPEEGSVPGKRLKPVRIDHSTVLSLGHLPQPDAAKQLGISLTSLKHVCRKLDIERWPYQKTQKGNRSDPISPTREYRSGRARYCHGTKIEVNKTGSNLGPRPTLLDSQRNVDQQNLSLHENLSNDLGLFGIESGDMLEAAHEFGSCDGMSTESCYGGGSHPSRIQLDTTCCKIQDQAPTLVSQSDILTSCPVQLDHTGSLTTTAAFNHTAKDCNDCPFQQQPICSSMPRDNTRMDWSEHDYPTPGVWVGDNAQAVDQSMNTDSHHHWHDTAFDSAQVDSTCDHLSRALPCQNSASSVPSRHAAYGVTWSQRLSILMAAPAATDLTTDRDFIDIVEAQAVPGYLERCAAESTSCLGNLFPPP